MSNAVYVTAEGLKKMEEELQHLKDVSRVEVAERLKEAISFWDLSENAEYEEARNVQSQVEVRIKELEVQLKNVELIDDTKKDTSKVNMWDSVTLESIESKEKIEYLIVGSTESDILSNPPKISNESAVGAAIMWKKKGVSVKVKSGNWIKEYKILKIS